VPQATQELRDAWDHDNYMDKLALDHLKNSGFTWASGMIKAPEDYEPTEEDYSAIDYLCQEWDYGWIGVD
jgi:hypothetical protein